MKWPLLPVHGAAEEVAGEVGLEQDLSAQADGFRSRALTSLAGALGSSSATKATSQPARGTEGIRISCERLNLKALRHLSMSKRHLLNGTDCTDFALTPRGSQSSKASLTFGSLHPPGAAPRAKTYAASAFRLSHVLGRWFPQLKPRTTAEGANNSMGPAIS